MKHTMEDNLNSFRLIEFTEYAVLFAVALVSAIGLLQLVGLMR